MPKIRFALVCALGVSLFSARTARAYSINTAYVGLGSVGYPAIPYSANDGNVNAFLKKLRDDFGINRIMIHHAREAIGSNCSVSSFKWVGTGYVTGESPTQSTPPAILGAFLRQAQALGMTAVIGLTMSMTACDTYFDSTTTLPGRVATDAEFAANAIMTAYGGTTYTLSLPNLPPPTPPTYQPVQFYIVDEFEPSALVGTWQTDIESFFSQQATKIRAAATSHGLGTVVINAGPALGDVLDLQLSTATVATRAVHFRLHSGVDIVWWQDSVGAYRTVPLQNSYGFTSVTEYMAAIKAAYQAQWPTNTPLLGGNVELFNGGYPFSDVGVQNNPTSAARLNQQIYAEGSALGGTNPLITTWYAPWQLVGSTDVAGHQFEAGSKPAAPRLGAGYRALSGRGGSYYAAINGLTYPRVYNYYNCPAQINGTAAPLGSALFNTVSAIPRTLASWPVACPTTFTLYIDLGQDRTVDYIEAQTAQFFTPNPTVRIPTQVILNGATAALPNTWFSLATVNRPTTPIGTDGDYVFSNPTPLSRTVRYITVGFVAEPNAGIAVGQIGVFDAQ